MSNVPLKPSAEEENKFFLTFPRRCRLLRHSRSKKYPDVGSSSCFLEAAVSPAFMRLVPPSVPVKPFISQSWRRRGRRRPNSAQFLVCKPRCSFPPIHRGGVRVPCPAGSWWRSGFLGPRGQDDGGGEAVHAQCRDVDLVTAVGGKLGTETQTR